MRNKIKKIEYAFLAKGLVEKIKNLSPRMLIFSYPPVLTYVLDVQMNHLIE